MGGAQGVFVSMAEVEVELERRTRALLRRTPNPLLGQSEWLANLEVAATLRIVELRQFVNVWQPPSR